MTHLCTCKTHRVCFNFAPVFLDKTRFCAGMSALASSIVRQALTVVRQVFSCTYLAGTSFSQTLREDANFGSFFRTSMPHSWHILQTFTFDIRCHIEHPCPALVAKTHSVAGRLQVSRIHNPVTHVYPGSVRFPVGGHPGGVRKTEDAPATDRV